MCYVVNNLKDYSYLYSINKKKCLDDYYRTRTTAMRCHLRRHL